MELNIWYLILCFTLLEVIGIQLVYKLMQQKVRKEIQKEMQKVIDTKNKNIIRLQEADQRVKIQRADWMITEEERNLLLGDTVVDEKTEINVTEKKENIKKAIEEELLIEDLLQEILSC